MDCSPPGFSIHGVFQARIQELVAISFSRGIFPTQGLNPGLPHCRQMLYPLRHQGSQCSSSVVPEVSFSRFSFHFLGLFFVSLKSNTSLNLCVNDTFQIVDSIWIKINIVKELWKDEALDSWKVWLYRAYGTGRKKGEKSFTKMKRLPQNNNLFSCFTLLNSWTYFCMRKKLFNLNTWKYN